MQDIVALTKRCIELAKKTVENPDERAAPEGGGSFATWAQIAMLLIKERRGYSYEEIEEIIREMERVRDLFGLSRSETPCHVSLWNWYQELTMEVWRRLLRHSAELAGISGHAAIDASGFERDQASSHYRYRVDYSFESLKVTILVDTESLAVLDVHCTTEKKYDGHVGLQVGLRNAADLQSLSGDKGYDWAELRERLREQDVRPLIKHREFSSLDKAHNARLDDELYGQRAMSESVFSMIKQRSGAELKAKTWYGQFREVAMKCVAHNLTRAAA